MRETVWTAFALGALTACNPPQPAPTRAVTAGAELSARADAGVAGDPGGPEDGIPAPSAMVADVVVSGLTSTMKRIDMVNVGRHVPRTYARERLGNSPGFSWWVSKHYALKTDRTEAHARLYLELLELAYPHYVEHFGDEPPGIEHTRIPVVYASSWNQAREVMIDDGIMRGPSGGGETMYFNKVGYSFPSFYEEHQRYIVIHETAHGFQMCLSGESRLMPTWFTEGIADSLAHHVYDPDAHRLTVMVFDRGPKDYMQHGLDEYTKAGAPTFRALNDSPELRRGLNFLMIHYLQDDPSRNARFAVWRDELLARRLDGEPMLEASAELLEQLYGPWEDLERDFAAWVAALPASKTFRVADEGWEQDGDSFWIRDREAKPRTDLRRIDVALTPSESPRPAPSRMDYPAHPASDLVGAVRRGVEAPSVGALIHYVEDREDRGELGLGLGRDGDELVTVTVEGGRWLEVDARSVGGQLHRHGLPAPVTEGLRSEEGRELGLRVEIGAESLTIQVRARSGATELVVPVTEDVHKKLLERPVSVVARGADHRITPVLDDGRPAPESFDRPAPGNRFRDPGMGLARRLAHTRWVLGVGAPAELGDALESLVGAPPAGRDAARAAVLRDMETLATAVDGTGDRRDRALAALAGLRLRLERTVDGKLAVRLSNASEQAVQGTVEVKSGATVVAAPRISAPAGGATVLPVKAPAADALTASAVLAWRGRKLEVSTGEPVLDRAGLELTAHTEREGAHATVHVDLAGPLAAGARGKLEIRAVGADSIEVVHDVDLSAGKSHAVREELPVPPGTPIQVTALLEADGEPVKVEAIAKAN